MVEAGASEQRAVDQAALAHESMVNSDGLLVQAKDRLLLLESRLAYESGQVVQNAASRDRWKKSYEALARDRAVEQAAAEEYTSNLQQAEERLVEAQDKFNLLTRDRADAEPRLRELERTASRAEQWRARELQLSGELESAHMDATIATATYQALESKNEATEDAYTRATARHKENVERFQALIATLREEQASHRSQLREAEEKAGIDEEQVRSCVEAMERAERRVAQLEASNRTAEKSQAAQLLLNDRSSEKVAELTRAIEHLTREKESAEQMAGEAMAEMQAAGRIDDQRSAELFEVRQMLLAKTTEVSRLQQPLLTDQSGSNPELSAKLASTVNYLGQCTDAFNTLRSEANLKLQGAAHEQQKLTSQLADAQVKSDDLARQLASARAETATTTQQLSLSQVELTRTADLLDAATQPPPTPPSPVHDRRGPAAAPRRRSSGGDDSGRRHSRADSGRSRDRADPSRRPSSQRDDREQDGDGNRSSRQGCREQSQGNRSGGGGDPDDDSDHESSGDDDARDNRKRGKDKSKDKGRDKSQKRGRKGGDPPGDSSDSSSSSDSDSRSSDDRAEVLAERRRTSCKFPTPHHGFGIELLETNAAW